MTSSYYLERLGKCERVYSPSNYRSAKLRCKGGQVSSFNDSCHSCMEPGGRSCGSSWLSYWAYSFVRGVCVLGRDWLSASYTCVYGCWHVHCWSWLDHLASFLCRAQNLEPQLLWSRVPVTVELPRLRELFYLGVWNFTMSITLYILVSNVGKT